MFITSHSVENYFDISEFPFPELFTDVQYVWDILKIISPFLKKQKLGQILGDVSPQAYLISPELISVGRGSVIEPGAYIKGPCLIGENCTVRHGAYIRGDCITGNKVVIGHDTEVKNALFLNGAHAAHFAYVGDSILGNRVNLGAGTKLANLRLNNQSIKIEGTDTGIRKFGAILGDDAQTGCNSVLNPGTMVGKGSVILPSLNVGGVIGAQVRVEGDFSLRIRPKT